MTPMTIDQAMQVAFGHHQSGRLPEAEALYRQVLARSPDHADALHWLGVLAGQVGRLEGAIDLIGRAIAVNPGVAEYHSNLGEIYRRSGQTESAVASLRRATQLNPGLAIAHLNLGNALRTMGQLDPAIAAFGRALELEPDHAEALNNLGVALFEAGRPEEAIVAFRRVIALRPGYADAHNNLGNALNDRGLVDEALAALGRAIELAPESALAYNSLGKALWDKGRLDEARVALDRAIALRPDYAEPHCNLGNVLKDQGRLDEALACFRRALELKPGFAEPASNLLFSVHYHPDFDAQAILAEHRDWARRYADPVAREVSPHSNDPSPLRRLRVGYLSPDLRDHAVGQLLRALFPHFDRRQTEIVCYSDVRVPDRVTETLRSQADEWHDIVGTSDQRLAGRIRADRIDILVDPTLHTANNRIRVLARKPAPVQVTMLGPPATTGLTTIDYRLTDPYLDPPGVSDADYSEQSIRLPHCFWIYRPPDEAPPVGALPALKNGFVTFGCLNQFAKVSRPALHLWVRILQCVPGSRLVLQSPPGSHQEAVRRLFAEGDIAVERVEFVGRAARADYFRLYGDLDLCLDPFPYNGHTSTLDALWMGVPVVTLAGRTGVGRGGVSILSNVGLPELIAETPEQYVAIAVALAADHARLSELRAGLRPRMQSSPLLDARQFAADVEAAFRRMWTTWCGA